MIRLIANFSILCWSAILLTLLFPGSHALADDQLVHVNYDVKLTVDEQYGEVQQRGIAVPSKTIVIELGKHQIDVLIELQSAKSYMLGVSVFEVIGDKRVKLSDDTRPHKSSFGIPSQVEIKNEVLELDLSIVVGQPFENSTD